MKRQRLDLVNAADQGPVFIRPRSAKRPIDKSIVFVNKTGISGSQVQTTLSTTTFPCTIVGLRWEISAVQSGGTGVATFLWAVVVIRDGDSADTLVFSDAGSVYEPEQNVLTWGTSLINNNTNNIQWKGDTKTMRKMMGGDQLAFICIGEATNTMDIHGIIQFFCKA